MKHIVVDLLTRLSDRPVLWVFAFAVPLSCVLALYLASPRFANALKRVAPWINCVNVLVVIGSVTVCMAYLATPAYIDHLEPAIASISWLFWSGKPVYHDMQTNARYSLTYGPYLFMINGSAEGFLGPSIFTSRLSGCVSIIVATAVLYRVIQCSTRHMVALAAVGTWVGLMFHFTNPYPYVGRADALLIACVTVGLAAAISHSWAGAALLGAACGVAVNLKLHALAYFGPIVVMAYTTDRRASRMIATTSVSMCIALLPFIAFSNVSIRNYGLALRLAAAHGFNVHEFGKVVEWLAVMLVPAMGGVVVSFVSDSGTTRRVLRQHRSLIVAMCISALCLAVPASKHGAGPHHWLPLMPTLVWLTVALYRSGLVIKWRTTVVHAVVGVLLASWTMSLHATSLLNMYQSLKRCNRATRETAQVIEHDVRSLVERHGLDSVLLFGTGADGESYSKTFYRPLLVFHGMPIGIDPAGLMEFKRAGVAMPSMKDLVAEVGARNPGKKEVLWVLPKTTKPFAMPTYYYPNDSLYGRDFRDDFTQNWSLREATEFYDIYAPKKDEAAACLSPKRIATR